MTETRRYRGFLALHDHGEGTDILFLENTGRRDYDEPLAETISDDMEAHGHYLTVRYWTAGTPASDGKMIEGAIREMLGAGEAEFGHRYSEITGYLWTDEDIQVGGIFRALSDALEDEDVNPGLVIEVMRHLAADETGFSWQDRIDIAARAMTAAQVAFEAQNRVFTRAFGVRLGRGGSGNDTERYPKCPWCGAHGGGGHGGFCPGPRLGYPPLLPQPGQRVQDPPPQRLVHPVPGRVSADRADRQPVERPAPGSHARCEPVRPGSQVMHQPRVRLTTARGPSS